MNNSDPIHRLPREILIDIFTTLIRSIAHKNPSNRFTNADNPQQQARSSLFGLTYISKAWRTFVCSAPELWSTCWFSQIQPKLNSLWLSRTSSTRPVHLNGLASADRKYGKRQVSALLFIDSILPYAGRIHTLIICSDVFFTSDPGLEQLKGPCVLPNLKVFRSLPPSEGCPLHIDRNMLPWMRDIVRSAPRLRTYEAWEADALKTLDACTLTNLVNLSISRYSSHTYSDILGLLQKAPALQTIAWPDCHKEYSIKDTLDTHLQHAQLTKLGLQSTCADFFDSVTLPALQCLSCSLTSERLLRSISLFFERSECAIRTLHFDCVDLDSDETVELFIPILQNSAVNPSIKVLFIKFEEQVAPELFEFWAEDTNLPKLRRLKIHAKYPQGRLEEQAFIDFIEAFDARIEEERELDRFAYLECYMEHTNRHTLGRREINMHGTSGAITRWYKKFARETGGKVLYDPDYLFQTEADGVCYGHLDARDAFEDDKDVEEMEPWIWVPNTSFSRRPIVT